MILDIIIGFLLGIQGAFAFELFRIEYEIRQIALAFNQILEQIAPEEENDTNTFM